MAKEIKQLLKEVFKEREKGTYYRKYDFGFLVVIGGSDYYSGSPALSAMAAFNAGVDMVRVLAPERAANIIASFTPDIATYPLEGKWLEKKHLPILLSLTESAKEVSRGNVAVVIGGGVGRTKETQNTILEYLENVSVPVVIDADAIHALRERPEVVKNKGFLITPHSYEFYTLTKKEIYKLPHKDKIEIVKQEAARLKTTILLKEKPDIITDGNEVALNDTGSPYMSVGGTGDTLAGICGAMLARKIDAFTAARLAIYINGKAGEMAADKLKEGLLATEVIKNIPFVLH